LGVSSVSIDKQNYYDNGDDDDDALAEILKITIVQNSGRFTGKV